MSSETIEISVTYATKQDALIAARSLVEKMLAACVHIEGPLTSVYRWKDEIAEETEWQLTAKTRVALEKEVITHLQQSHPYDLPVILTHTTQTSDDVAAWIAAETKP
ncbi:MAG: divalent-cation tolerance protein CutA [Parvibaculum sp.]